MSRQVPALLTFNGGEVDDNTLVRVDLPIHPHTAETMENISLTTAGAMSLAPGSRYLDNTLGDAFAKLMPWSFSVDLSYVLEFTAGTLRFIYGTGLSLLDGAVATLAAWTDESGAPSGGDTPPTGGGTPEGANILSVSLDLSGWIAKKGGGYYTTGSFSATGGTGTHTHADLIVDGEVVGATAYGSVYYEATTADPTLIAVRAYDDAGNYGVSNTELVT